MTLVSRANGTKLAALARMRDRTIGQLADLRLLVDDFYGPKAFAFLVLAQGIGTLDAIRILLEHGYGRRALAMVRTLYDLEIDAFLLSTGDEELMSRYTRYERWERAVKAARLLYTADFDDERVKDGIAHRIKDLEQGLKELGQEPPEGFDQLTLETALQLYGKAALGKPYPRSWRDHLDESELLDLLFPLHVRAFSSDLESTDPDEFLKQVERRKKDHKLGYGLLSAIVHGSPESVAGAAKLDSDGRLEGVVVGGHPDDVPLTAGLAGLHFYRLAFIAARTIGWAWEAPEWLADLKLLQASDGD